MNKLSSIDNDKQSKAVGAKLMERKKLKASYSPEKVLRKKSCIRETKHLSNNADSSSRTTNRAKDDGNMQILIFHMYHIGLLTGVF